MKKNSTPFNDAEQSFIQQMIAKRTHVGQRYPLLFGMFVTFGLVATLEGFERLIDKVHILANNPWVLLATGITTLLLTGVAYQKLN